MSRGVKITPPPHAAPPRSAPTSPPPGLLSRGLRRGHKRTQPIQQARSRLAPCERGPAREAPLPLLRVLLLVERVGAHLQSAERRVQSVECKQRLAESTRGTRGTRHTWHSGRRSRDGAGGSALTWCRVGRATLRRVGSPMAWLRLRPRMASIELGSRTASPCRRMAARWLSRSLSCTWAREQVVSSKYYVLLSLTAYCRSPARRTLLTTTAPY